MEYSLECDFQCDNMEVLEENFLEFRDPWNLPQCDFFLTWIIFKNIVYVPGSWMQLHPMQCEFLRKELEEECLKNHVYKVYNVGGRMCRIQNSVLTLIDPNYVCWLTRTEGMYVDTQTITVTGQNIKLPGSWVIADEFRRNRLIQNVLDEWRHYGPQKIGGFVVDNKLWMTTTENRVVNIGQHNQIYYSPTNFRLAKRKIYKYFEKNIKYPWEYCTGGVFGVYGFSHRLSHFRQHPHLPFVVDGKLFELQSNEFKRIYCTQTPPQELKILEINEEDFL